MSLINFPGVPNPYFGGMNVTFAEGGLDSSGNGAFSYEDVAFGSSEVDKYQHHKIVYAHQELYGYIQKTAYFDPAGRIYKFDKVDQDYSGFDFRFADPRYDFVQYNYSGPKPDAAGGGNYYAEQYEYTSKGGEFYFHSKLLGYGFNGDGKGSNVGSDIEVQISDPLTHAINSYQFLGHTNQVSYLLGKPTYTQTLDNGDVIKGQMLGAEASRTLEYDASLGLVREVRFDWHGVVYESTRLANGDMATKHYTGEYNQAFMDTYTVKHADGSSSETYLNIDGKITRTVERGADNSSDVLSFNDGVLTSHVIYSAGGKLAVTDSVSGGSHTIIAHQSGQVLEGGAGSDTFTDFGATTFVFKGNFGADTIRGFDALAGVDHDVISFVGTSAQSFSDLAIQQVGANTNIIVNGHDYITLAGVNAAHVTADDFLFA